jgi:hypothetical protein
MALGDFFWFDRGLLKVMDGTVDLESDTIKAALCASTQALSRSFTGSSGDARYADLTAELSTANGYTAGGVALASVSLARSGSLNKFTSSAISWTITGAGVTFKYLVLYADGATNKDLLLVLDMDTGGGSVTSTAGSLTFTPDGSEGWGFWEQL